VVQDGYQIMLDKRVLKTPAKRPLTLPTRALALAIAAEWEWQVRAAHACFPIALPFILHPPTNTPQAKIMS
jgi:chaperone required for assembly of F1-ATPase